MRVGLGCGRGCAGDGSLQFVAGICRDAAMCSSACSLPIRTDMAHKATCITCSMLHAAPTCNGIGMILMTHRVLDPDEL